MPSDANTSDLPSRALEYGAMETYYTYFRHSIRGDSHMPPLDAWLPNGAASLATVFAIYGSWVGPQWEADDYE